MVRGRGRFKGVLNPDQYERPKKSELPKIRILGPKKVETESTCIDLSEPSSCYRYPGWLRVGVVSQGVLNPHSVSSQKKASFQKSEI